MANDNEQQGGHRRGAHFRQPGSEPQQNANGFSWSSASSSSGGKDLGDTDAFLEAARISQEARRRKAQSQQAQPPQTTTASERQTSRQTERQASRQTSRQAERQTTRQTSRQATRQTTRKALRPAPEPAALPPAASTPQPVRENINRYQRGGRGRNVEQVPRKRGFRPIYAVIIAVVLLFVGAGVAAAMYVGHINTKLTEKVTPELRQELVQKETGEPFYMLLLGIDKDQSRWEGDDSADYGSDDSNYRSDSIMLCRIDPKNIKVTMVSIHRDTMVDMDEFGTQKINNAYSYGGAAYATEVVSDFAGVDISHYAEIDLDRFIEVVEKVGGITVTLPVPVHDPEYTGLNLPAGTQTLTGEQAALLCRCRHGYDEYGDGDKFRAANQRMVFAEVIKKVLQSDPATMMTLISSMAESVTTDMDIAMILDLANQMKTLNTETDIMTGMEPTEGVYVNDTWYEMCNTAEWKKMMKRVDQGLPPYDTEDGEYDSTAGIAGGVGKQGQQAAANAVAADTNEALSNGGGDNGGDTGEGEEVVIVEWEESFEG